MLDGFFDLTELVAFGGLILAIVVCEWSRKHWKNRGVKKK